MRYDERHGRLERLGLSPTGLLVAVAGRLGRWLGTQPDHEDVPGPTATTGRWGTAVAWAYLYGTLGATIAVIPASWVHAGLGWKLAAGSAGPLAILGLTLAHGYAAPALEARCRRVTGTAERTMLRQGYEAVRTLRAARRRPGALALIRDAAEDQAVWELANALVAGETALADQRRVAAALARLARDDPLVSELRARLADLAELQSRAVAAAARHLAALCALADNCRRTATGGEPDRGS